MDPIGEATACTALIREDGSQFISSFATVSVKSWEYDLLRPASGKRAPVEWISEQSRSACTDDRTVTAASRHDTGEILWSRILRECLALLYHALEQEYHLHTLLGRIVTRS